MILDLENIIILRTIMKSLSEGVDPTSNIPFPDDTLLNSNLLKKCFGETSEIFSFLEKNIEAINELPHKKVKNQKNPFFILQQEINTIPISDSPVTISKFVFHINEICKRDTMRKLKATQITSWLTKQGYLEEIVSSNGDVYKTATKHGQALGITSIKKNNSRGKEYTINFYDKSAQKFILSQLLANTIL